MKAGRRLVSVLCLATSATSLAWSAEPAASASTGSGFAALMQGLLGLLVVLGALFVFFWVLRRFSPGQATAQGVVKVVGGVMLGTRERLVVVEVGDQWLLLGVGAGQVSHLHTMPRPPDAAPGPEGGGDGPLPGRLPASFAAKLSEFLARRKSN